MGHERVGLLPRTKPWRSIVAQISQIPSSESDVADLANTTLTNVRTQFRRIHKDEGIIAAFQFLVALCTLESSSTIQPQHAPAIDLDSNPSPLRLAADLHAWVEAHSESLEYANIAQKAATDTIALWSEQQKQQPNLFDQYNRATEVWRKASTGTGFCEVARIFFAKFTERYLNYFLEREASAVLPGVKERDQFAAHLRNHIDAVSKHAFETAKIAQSFAAGWFNKHAREAIPSNRKVESFLALAFGKLRDELQRESSQR